MSLLKKIPISFSGTLQKVELINFSVAPQELLHLPEQIAPRLINGRAMISMVNVHLKKMTANIFPIPFSYHHIALRLLVDDTFISNDRGKGIFFLRSFTNKKSIVPFANLFSNYRLEAADIQYRKQTRKVVTKENGFVSYTLDGKAPEINNPNLHSRIQQLDRAYAVTGTNLFVTQITRKHWPIKWANCIDFKTNLFKSVRFEGAFIIDQDIHYIWNKPKLVKPL